jgi:hypothetical protein
MDVLIFYSIKCFSQGLQFISHAWLVWHMMAGEKLMLGLSLNPHYPVTAFHLQFNDYIYKRLHSRYELAINREIIKAIQSSDTSLDFSWFRRTRILELGQRLNTHLNLACIDIVCISVHLEIILWVRCWNSSHFGNKKNSFSHNYTYMIDTRVILITLKYCMYISSQKNSVRAEFENLRHRPKHL